MKWNLDSGRLNEGNVPVQDWGWRCRDGGITKIGTKQNEQGAGTRPGERFLSNQPLSRLEKGHGRVLGSGGGQVISTRYCLQDSKRERYDDLGILRLEALDNNKNNQKCQKQTKPTTSPHHLNTSLS